MRWFLVLLTACSSSDSTSCDLERIRDCADCGGGEARHVWGQREVGSSTSIAPTATGLAYATCDSVVILDNNYDVAVHRSHEVRTPWSHATRLAAHDDTIYGVTADRGEPVDEFEDPPRPLHTFFALALDGTDRFRQDFGTASPGYVIPEPGGFYLHDEADLRAFDSSGTLRWMSASRGALATDGAGGLVSVTKPGGPGSGAITLERIDAGGVSLWTKTWTTSMAPNNTFIHVSPFAGRDGGIAVTGQFHGNLDLGDRVLPGTQNSLDYFVARLGPDGSTKWALAFTFEEITNFQHDQIVVLDDDRVVLIGSYTNAVPGNVLDLPKPFTWDAFAVVIDGTGAVTRTTVLGGDGEQYPYQVVPLADGTIAIEMETSNGALQVGSTRFSGYDAYVFTLVP